MKRNALTICISMFMILFMVATASALTFEQAKARAKAAATAAKKAAMNPEPAVRVPRAEPRINASPASAKEVEEFTIRNGVTPLSYGELMVLEAKISDSPTAIQMLRKIVEEGRAITAQDAALLEQAAAAEQARDLYEGLIDK